MPAMVGSTKVGNTLLVPVERGINVTSGAWRAMARLVPSPPKETMWSTPWARNAATAASVSAALWVSGVLSTCTRAESGISDRASDAMRNGS